MDKNLFSLFFLPKSKQFIHYTDSIEATLYYRDFKINLLNGSKMDSSVSEINYDLEKYQIDGDYEDPLVWHLFYELGFSYVEMEDKLPRHKPLALKIRYSSYNILKNINELIQYDSKLALKITEYPSLKKYSDKFKSIQKHLHDGDCYQVNLTEPFYFNFEEGTGIEDFIVSAFSDIDKLGDYAHLTFIDSMGKIFLSNSPECLFEIEKNEDDFKIISKPIKGTLKMQKEDDKDLAWKKLSESKKDEGELFMISDLIRNDLAKINLTKATIKNKKIPLFVPGLVHQLSIIETSLDEKVNLRMIAEALFPGGSITGAPKKRVMEIIDKTETYLRGFYCGSTILFHNDHKKASINIRSAVVDTTQNELFYGAGGAITLLSKVNEEFDESYAKMESFLQFLKVENINKG